MKVCQHGRLEQCQICDGFAGRLVVHQDGSLTGSLTYQSSPVVETTNIVEVDTCYDCPFHGRDTAGSVCTGPNQHTRPLTLPPYPPYWCPLRIGPVTLKRRNR